MASKLQSVPVSSAFKRDYDVEVSAPAPKGDTVEAAVASETTTSQQMSSTLPSFPVSIACKRDCAAKVSAPKGTAVEAPVTGETITSSERMSSTLPSFPVSSACKRATVGRRTCSVTRSTSARNVKCKAHVGESLLRSGIAQTFPSWHASVLPRNKASPNVSKADLATEAAGTQ